MSGPMVLNAAKTLCDLFYLAFTIWREARGVSRAAQIAVGWTLPNRVKRPGWWGTSIDSVATKRLQYSSLTDPNDKQLTTWPLLSDPSWLACLGVAYDILHGEAVNLYPGADSYYDTSISAPKWTKDAVFCGKIDNLLFYDVDHDHEADTIVAAAPVEASFDVKTTTAEVAALVAGAPVGEPSDFQKTLRDWLAAPKGP